MSYVSGEFNPSTPSIAPWPGSACVVTNSDASSTLWYAYGTSGGGLVYATVGIDDVGRGAPAQPKSWTSTNFSVDGWNSAGPPGTQAACGLVARPAPLLAWNDSSIAISGNSLEEGLWAAEYGGGDNPKRWGALVRLLGNGPGSPALQPSRPSAGVGAAAWGSDVMLISCSDVNGTGLYLGIFSVGDRDTTANRWVPRHQYEWNVSTFKPLIGDVESTGDVMNLAWFTSGDPESDPGKPQPPATYLAMSLAPTSGNSCTPVIGYVRLRFDQNSFPYVDPDDEVTWDVYEGSTPLSVARDPAGRLRTYGSASKSISVVTYATRTSPKLTAGAHALSVVRSELLPAPGAGGIPTVATFTDFEHGHQVTTQATALDGQIRPFPALQYPAWEVILYGGATAPTPPPTSGQNWVDTSVSGQVRSFGFAQSIENQVVLNRAPQNPDDPTSPPLPSNVVVGIIDGPIPAQNANIASDEDLGDIVYSADRSDALEHQVAFEWSAGFKSDGHPATGLGLAWNISLSGGTGTTTDSMTQTIYGSQATMSSYPEAATPPASGYEMTQTGRALCTTASAAYRAYRWLDSVGPQLSGPPSTETTSDSSVRLYGRRADGALLFFLGTAGTWGMDNLSWEVNTDNPVLVAGDPVAGASALADGGHGHVYVKGIDGHLLRFDQSAAGWTYHDVTAAGGTGIVGEPAPVMIGPTEHVFALGAQGHVTDQWATSADPSSGSWTALDISHTQKPDFVAASSPPTTPSVQATANADGTTSTVSVAFTSPTGHAVVLFNPAYPTASTWTHNDYTQTAGPSSTVAGNTVLGPAGVLAAGTGDNHKAGDLVRWFYAPAHGSSPAQWKWEDISTQIGNQLKAWTTMAGDPTPCQTMPTDSLMAAAGRRQDGHVLLFTKLGTAPWTANDLTADAVDGTLIVSDLSFPDPQHIYATGTDGHLLAFTADSTQITNAEWVVTDVSVACGAAGGAVIHDSTSPTLGQAPSWTAIAPISVGYDDAEYPLYGPLAGDITSYTAYSWNQRMQQLADSQPSANLYAGTDYVAYMVKTAAYPLSPTKGMENSWGQGANWGQPNFKELTSKFVESSWTMDFEFYIGGGFGGLADPITLTGLCQAIGMNEAWEFLVGGSLHSSHTTTATESSDWGLTLTGPSFSGPWGSKPQHPPPVGGMASYTFDIYFFPPPDESTGLTETYWTAELIAGLTQLKKADPAVFSTPGYIDPSTIDPGSGSWKIMYVVTSYVAHPTLSIDASTPPAPGATISLSGRYYGTSADGGNVSANIALLRGTDLLLSGHFPLDPNGNFGENSFVAPAALGLPADLTAGTYTINVQVGTVTGTSQFTIS